MCTQLYTVMVIRSEINETFELVVGNKELHKLFSSAAKVTEMRLWSLSLRFRMCWHSSETCNSWRRDLMRLCCALTKRLRTPCSTHLSERVQSYANFSPAVRMHVPLTQTFSVDCSKLQSTKTRLNITWFSFLNSRLWNLIFCHEFEYLWFDANDETEPRWTSYNTI